MRKDRNCQANVGAYPVYPMYGGYMPQMPIPTPMMPNNQISYPVYEQNSTSNLEEQIRNLEKRVSRLESMISQNKNTYNDSNFYMV